MQSQTISHKLNLTMKKWQNWLEWVGIFLIISFFLLRWLAKFNFTPDAGFYMTAAINFIKHGTFFVYLNWPVRTLLPGTQMYADFPPGFPSYLSIFLFLFKDPLLAVAIAQSVALVALFLAVYRTTLVLGLSPLFRLTVVFFLGLFAPHRITLTSLLTEPLYLFLCFCALLCAIELTKKGDSKKRWWLAYISLFLAAAVRWNGFACVAFFIIPLLKNRKNFWLKTFSILFAGALPISLWFVRNMIQVGSASKLYGLTLLLDKVLVPFVASVFWWGHGSIFITVLIVFLALLPIFIKKLREDNDLTAYWIIGIGSIAQFLVIYGLSLVVFITPVDDRYLMPAYFLFTIALFYSLNIAVRAFRVEKVFYACAFLGALMLIPQALEKIKLKKLDTIGKWTIPVEAKLWEEIKTRPYFANATHYYSSENYIFQIFAEKPQVVLWNKHMDATEIKPLVMQPKSFFVIDTQSQLKKVFEEHFEKEISGIKKEVIHGFTIYYL